MHRPFHDRSPSPDEVTAGKIPGEIRPDTKKRQPGIRSGFQANKTTRTHVMTQWPCGETDRERTKSEISAVKPETNASRSAFTHSRVSAYQTQVRSRPVKHAVECHQVLERTPPIFLVQSSIFLGQMGKHFLESRHGGQIDQCLWKPIIHEYICVYRALK